MSNDQTSHKLDSFLICVEREAGAILAFESMSVLDPIQFCSSGNHLIGVLCHGA